MAQHKKLVVALTGASGAIYAQRTLRALAQTPHQVEIVASRTGTELFRQETGQHLDAFIHECVAEGADFKLWNSDDFYAPFSSGSQPYDAMVVVPCTVGFLGRAAAGIANDLGSRAADAFLKEGRRLVLVVRETPLSDIHLENMLRLRRAGAVILPANPGFYTRPADIEELVDGIVQRILDQIGLEDVQVHRRWREGTVRRREASRHAATPRPVHDVRSSDEPRGSRDT
jgi:4-hydroxy-3-polyprenylbenzoate decarboxylase